MERIDVWRGEPGLDADGNTVQGPLELVMSFDDLIGVRGRRVPVDGVVCVWEKPDGTHVGDVVNVRLKEG